MSGEDPIDYGDYCTSFRTRCQECGKQVVFENGERLPDCGHPLTAVVLDE